MKRFSGITFLFMLFFSCNSSTSHDIKQNDNNKVKNFTVVIEEWSWLSKTIYKITNDSIVITSLNENQAKSVEILKPGNMSGIHRAIDKIDLSKLKNQYVMHDGPDDYIEFDFSFDIDGEKKQVAVFLTRVEELYQLVAEINNFLPKHHKINYDAEYFKIAAE